MEKTSIDQSELLSQLKEANTTNDPLLLKAISMLLNEIISENMTEIQQMQKTGGRSNIF